MKRRSIIFALVAAFVATFIGFTHPLAVHAACRTLSGTYQSTGTPFTSPNFTYSTGDTVTASNIPSSGGISNVSLEININGTTYVFGTGGATSATGFVKATSNGTGHVFFANNNNAPNPPVAMNWKITVGTDCGESGFNFTDGRVNSHDGQETAAVYCEGDGSVSIWAIYQSAGYFAFKVTAAELDAVPEHPAKNTLIKAGLGVALYRLTTGELQINSANDYVFIWSGCNA